VIDKYKVLEFMARKRISKQTELASRLGVTRQSLSNWLTGKDKPTTDNLIALCQELECTFDDIVIIPKGDAPVLALSPA
jgi:DNA-binding Xre family transcriptional regulator